MKMKIAQALEMRADSLKKISNIKERIEKNVKLPENEKPIEDPIGLIELGLDHIREYHSYVKRINKANMENEINGINMSELLLKKDKLMIEKRFYDRIINKATSEYDRWSRSEVKSYVTVDVNKYQKICDKLGKEIRELNMKIQENNWKFEI